MEEKINIISNFGFPIALVIYFLGRFEKKIDELSKSLEILADQLDNQKILDDIMSNEYRRRNLNQSTYQEEKYN